MKRIAVFGCKHTTLFMVNALRQKTEVSKVITISPSQGEKADVADYCDMEKYCRENAISSYVANKYTLKDEADQKQIANMKLDVGFVIGWQRLVPPEVLNSFSIGVFGMHGSADDLPLGRGRSPMNWSLIEGRNNFYTNLFRYDPGVDSGDILDTFVFSIQNGDTAETMHYKNVLAMKALIIRNLEKLFSGDFVLKKQRDITPTYYPKRTPEDSLIDWNQDVFRLEAFVRAVTRPFNGSYTYLNGDKITIFRAEIFETDLVDYGYRNEETGTILEVFPNGKFIVKCRGGLLIVHEYETTGKVAASVKLHSPEEKIHRFEMNRYGNFDIVSTT